MTVTDEGTSTAVAGELRPRRRGLWLVIAGLTAIVLIAPVLWAGAVFLMRHTQEHTAVYVRPISVLRVDAPAGQVRITAAGPGQTRVAKLVRWEFGRPPAVRQVWHGRTLTISSAPCAGGPLKGYCNVTLAIRVPPTVAVQVTSVDGQVSIRGLSGQIRAHVASGSVRLADDRGYVQVQVGSGSASAVALGSGQVDAAVASGSLRLAFARPPRLVTARIGTGTATVIVPAGSRYRVAATAGPDVSSHVSQALVSPSSPRLIRLSAVTGTIRLAAACCQAPRPGGRT